MLTELRGHHARLVRWLDDHRNLCDAAQPDYRALRHVRWQIAQASRQRLAFLTGTVFPFVEKHGHLKAAAGLLTLRNETPAYGQVLSAFIARWSMEAVMADPDWHHGRYFESDTQTHRGLAVARKAGHITYLSDAALHRKFGRRLQVFDQKLPKGRWMVGGNWDHDRAFGGKLPTAAIVDQYVPDRPVFIRRYDGHMALANTVALKLAKVTADTKVKAKPALKVQEIKPGTRIVVSAVEEKDKSMTAKTIEVGAAPAAAK